MDFNDKVVLVTGASRGIGRVIAQQFAAQGAKVILVARNIGQLKELEFELLRSGGDALAIAADIADPLDVQALALEVGVSYGRVDILINKVAVGDGPCGHGIGINRIKSPSRSTHPVIHHPRPDGSLGLLPYMLSHITWVSLIFRATGGNF